MGSDHFEALNELLQRQQVQLDSRNDLLGQRDAEIDRLKDKIDNQAMDVYFKVADEMSKQFKDYYTAPNTFQQMDELLDDLKKQSSQENAENKALFASISTLESEMQKYDQWITTTKDEMQKLNHQSSPPKSEDIETKEVSVEIKTEYMSSDYNMVEKEKLESLQNLVNTDNKGENETKAIDYNDSSNLRSALVNTTLTNLHVLHQYKQLLNLVKGNFMTRPRANKNITP